MSRLEEYTVAELQLTRIMLEDAEAYLDSKGISRWHAEHGRLNLLKRLMILMGDPLPKIDSDLQHDAEYED